MESEKRNDDTLDIPKLEEQLVREIRGSNVLRSSPGSDIVNKSGPNSTDEYLSSLSSEDSDLRVRDTPEIDQPLNKSIHEDRELTGEVKKYLQKVDLHSQSGTPYEELWSVENNRHFINNPTPELSEHIQINDPVSVWSKFVYSCCYLCHKKDTDNLCDNDPLDIAHQIGHNTGSQQQSNSESYSNSAVEENISRNVSRKGNSSTSESTDEGYKTHNSTPSSYASDIVNLARRY